MARISRGRKPAKNENATALINALTFTSSIKAPPASAPDIYDYTIMNAGYAIGFNGVVAAGHPIPEGISGCPHTKLLLEALDNTDKTFDMTLHDSGAFEVMSSKYQALVPTSADAPPVLLPDTRMQAIKDPDGLLGAFKAVNKIIVETGTDALFSAAKFSGDLLKATNGQIILEAYHGNDMPPVIIPKEFIATVLKLDKKPAHVGINPHDWSTFTLWYDDGSWLRTNVYPAEVWPDKVDAAQAQYIDGLGGIEPSKMSPKFWAAVKAVLPFAVDRVIANIGIIKTHPDRNEGACIELAGVNFDFEFDGKLMLSVEDYVTEFVTGMVNDNNVMLFRSEKVRGILLGKHPAEVAAPADGWGNASQPAETRAGTAESDGWGSSPETIVAAVEPPPEPPKEWKGGPTVGMSDSPEFKSQYTGAPEEVFTPVEVEEAYLFEGPDLGVSLGFKVSEWLEERTEENNVSGWGNS